MKATYVSVWDDGMEIRSECTYNPETKDVTDIESVDVDGFDLEILMEEYVELPDGTKVEDYTIEGEEIEE